MLHNSNSRGFTIIEIITIIAIISLLSSIIAVNASKSRSVARDGQRVSDLTTIQNALNLYFADNKKYPPTITTSLATYLPIIPKDPKTGSSYRYAGIDNSSPASLASCESYHLGAGMENKSNIALNQDKDSSISTACAGSTADFSGISKESTGVACFTSVLVADDQCFDLTP